MPDQSPFVMPARLCIGGILAESVTFRRPSPRTYHRQTSTVLLHNYLNLKEIKFRYASGNHAFLDKLAESVTFRCI
jgi:hypothetical protein